MATWSIVGVSNATVNASGNYTLTEPAGCAANDILVVDFAIRSTVIFTNAAWTFPQSDSGGNTTNNLATADTSFQTGYCIRGASAPTLVFSRTGGSRALGTIRAYRSSNSGAPTFHTSAKFAHTTGTTAIALSGGITTTEVDQLLVTGVYLARGVATGNASLMDGVVGVTGESGTLNTTFPPANNQWTERIDRGDTTSPTVALAGYEAVKTTIGSTGNLTCTAVSSALHGITVMAFKHPPLPTADAWNINDKTANLTLSNSDRTATSTNATDAAARSTKTRPYTGGADGAYYAEFLLGSATTVYGVGICPMTSGVTTGADCVYLNCWSGEVFLQGTPIGDLATTFTTGDVVSMAWNAVSGDVWFRKNAGNWNNSGTADPATGTGGFAASYLFDSYALWTISTFSGTVNTVRTKFAQFTQSVPTGFSSWMGEVKLPVTTGTFALTGVAATLTYTPAGGGPLWTPALIPTGMQGWFDGADSGTLTFSGSNLTQWTDKSPTANHATPHTTGPTLTSVNSLGSLNFNAQGLKTTSAVSLGDFTVFAVFTPDASGNYERLIDHDFTNGFWLGRDASTATWGGGIRLAISPYGYFVSLANGSCHQVMMQRSGTTENVSGNGGAVSTSIGCTGTATTSNVIGIASAFNDATPTDRLNSDTISEILIWSNVLSAGDQSKVEGYLAWKWGIQASLPIGHPYKSAAPTTGVVNYTLTAATGTLTLTGYAALSKRSMAAVKGTLTLTGLATALRAARKLPAVKGTLTLTGYAALSKRSMAAVKGTLVLTGRAALSKRSMAAVKGTLTLTGLATALRIARKLPAVKGTLTLTGYAALSRRSMAALQGSYTLSGQTALLKIAYRMPAWPSVIYADGYAAGLWIGGGGSEDVELFPPFLENENVFELGSGDLFFPPVVGVAASELYPSLYTDPDTFYNHGLALAPAFYTDPDNFFAPAVTSLVTLSPLLYVDPDTFFPHIAGVGVSELFPNFYADPDTFYNHAAVPGGVSLTPALYTDPDSFFATVATSRVTLSPPLYVDPDTFFPTTSVTSITVYPTLHSDPDTFYTHIVLRRTEFVTPALYVNPNTFYTHVLSWVEIVVPELYIDPDDFFFATASVGPVEVFPPFYTDADDLYGHTANSVYNLLPDLLAHSNIFYSGAVARNERLFPELFANANIFYDHVLEFDQFIEFQLFDNANIFQSHLISVFYDNTETANCPYENRHMVVESELRRMIAPEDIRLMEALPLEGTVEYLTRIARAEDKSMEVLDEHDTMVASPRKRTRR
jgi:hypothetical protein